MAMIIFIVFAPRCAQFDDQDDLFMSSSITYQSSTVPAIGRAKNFLENKAGHDRTTAAVRA
jgi:hypothetical protein